MSIRFRGWLLVGLVAALPSAAGAYRLATDAIPSVAGFATGAGLRLGVTVGLPVVGGGSNPDYREETGFWLQQPGTTTAINGENGSSPVPLATQLDQNFPNPFNPMTQFRFQIAGAESETRDARLEIFDVSGRRIAVLVDGSLAPGFYEVSWNGTNTMRQRVASGVYLARLTAGDYSRTIRVVVTK